jgi:hypothetical protein
MTGLVPVIPIDLAGIAIGIGIAGTSPAMTIDRAVTIE